MILFKMVIDDIAKWIYIGPYKCASNTLHDMLRKSPFGGAWYGGVKNWHSARIPVGRWDHFTFCTVRNPYDRVISMYEYYKKLNPNCSDLMNFPKFVTTLGTLHNWSTTISESVRGARIDAFIRVEYIREDLMRLRLTDQGLNVPHWNKGTYCHGKPYYTEPLISKVADWAREDFMRFGYPIEYKGVIDDGE